MKVIGNLFLQYPEEKRIKKGTYYPLSIKQFLGRSTVGLITKDYRRLVSLHLATNGIRFQRNSLLVRNKQARGFLYYATFKTNSIGEVETIRGRSNLKRIVPYGFVKG